jgi:acetate kinase
MHPEQASGFLKQNVPLFRDFSDDLLQKLVAGSKVVGFEPNEAIIEFGSEGRFLGVLLAGEAEVSVTDESGRPHRVRLLKAGDIYGEISLMTGDRTVANVIGATPGQTLLIPQPLFSTILMTQGSAIKYLSRLLVDRMKQLSDEEGKRLSESALKNSEDPYGFNLATDSPKKLLVVNCGSSSLKYNLFDTFDPSSDARGLVEKIGEKGTLHTYKCKKGQFKWELPVGGHGEAFLAMASALRSPECGVIRSLDEISAVGHRVVHGGERYSHPTVVGPEVMTELEKISELAPLHNPVNLLGIREATKALPHAPQVAVFDTAFHQTMPPYAYLYGLPYEYYQDKGIRRYGFHGTSHNYVALKAAEFLKKPYGGLEIITCHLGNGASMCAIDHGRSVDTSMGLTPAEGLLMGTRCGDLDPAVLIHLARTEGLDGKALDNLINKKSGLKGLSGLSNDMREVQKAALEGDYRALLAYKSFCYRIRKYVGAYVAAMGGLDVLVFTGGIGQGSAGVRSLACQGLGYMGISVDEEKNVAARNAEGICDISTDDSRVRVLVVPTDEERMIAREMLRALSSNQVTMVVKTQKPTPIPVEVSAHHVHLSQTHVEALFGPGHKLTFMHELSQPGQYACEEKVHLIGPKGRVDAVRVLGPARKESQIEISMTEQFKLGLHAPIRASGDIDGSPGLVLEGTAGKVAVEKGVICALRHVHMSPQDALSFGIRDKDVVTVRVKSERELIFGDVLVRVHPEFRLAMHIDTDEANASNVRTGVIGYIETIQRKM